MSGDLTVVTGNRVSGPRRRTRVWKWFVGTWRPLIMLLFRWRLGWLLGHGLLVVTHVGRRSGKVRRTIVYVQRYDPQTSEAMAVAAWGVTDWYRNLEVTPALEVQIATEHYVPDQRFLGAEEIAELELQFRQRHPLVARLQCWLMDWPWHCSESEFMDYARSLRGVAFQPKQG